MAQQQQQQQTVFDDVVLQELEQEYRGAIAKVFCLKDKGGEISPTANQGSTGFLVSLDPCIIITVAHQASSLEDYEEVLYDPTTFSVKFYQDPNTYSATVIKVDFSRDVLILSCLPGLAPSPSSFKFADKNLPVLTSTSVFTISHPNQRDWRTDRGAICCLPFDIGEHPTYRPDMQLFDHSIQLFPGSSGAPIINLMGRVVGMQLIEVTSTYHAVCIADEARKQITEYEDFNALNHQIKELTFRPCHLKQAATVNHLASAFRSMFVEEIAQGVDPDKDLTEFVTEAVVRYLERQGQAQGAPPAQGAPLAQGAPPAQNLPPQKKPRVETMDNGPCGGHQHQWQNNAFPAGDHATALKPPHLPIMSSSSGNLVVKRQSLVLPVLSVTERAAADRLPSCSIGYLDDNEKLDQFYQRQMLKEGLQKFIQKGKMDLKNQGNFRLPELFSLHENVRSRLGMANDMPECHGEQDGVISLNEDCQSDQEDIWGFLGITGCLHKLKISEKQVQTPLQEDLGSWGHHISPAHVSDANLQASAENKAAARVWREVQENRVYTYKNLSSGTIEGKIY